MNGRGILGNSSMVAFTEKSNVTFYYNSASGDGGAVNLYDSTMKFQDNATVIFIHNQAELNGGSVFAKNKSRILLNEVSLVQLHENQTGENGGALY